MTVYDVITNFVVQNEEANKKLDETTSKYEGLQKSINETKNVTGQFTDAQLNAATTQVSSLRKTQSDIIASNRKYAASLRVSENATKKVSAAQKLYERALRSTVGRQAGVARGALVLARSFGAVGGIVGIVVGLIGAGLLSAFTSTLEGAEKFQQGMDRLRATFTILKQSLGDLLNGEGGFTDLDARILDLEKRFEALRIATRAYDSGAAAAASRTIDLTNALKDLREEQKQLDNEGGFQDRLDNLNAQAGVTATLRNVERERLEGALELARQQSELANTQRTDLDAIVKFSQEYQKAVNELRKFDLETGNVARAFNRSIVDLQIERTARTEELRSLSGVSPLQAALGFVTPDGSGILKETKERLEKLFDVVDLTAASRTKELLDGATQLLNNGAPLEQIQVALEQSTLSASIDVLETTLDKLTEERIKLLDLSGGISTEAVAEVNTAISSVELKLSELQNALAVSNAQSTAARKEENRKLVNDAVQVANQAFDAFENAQKERVDQINGLIDSQIERLDRLRDSTLEANSDIVASEEEKLERLIQQRRRAAADIRALAALQFVANAALTISQVAVESGIAAPATIIATTAALIGAIGAIKGAAVFHSGTESIKLDNTWVNSRGNKEGYALVEEKERMLSVEDNQKVAHLSNAQLVRAGQMYTKGFTKSVPVAVPSDREYKMLKKVNANLEALKIEFKVDQKGFSGGLYQHMTKKAKISKMRK